ncbi:hypothetical protein [Pseudomonas sp. NPDC086251]|uniref:hypothetical protein n=1 Tax=Pseudomonas sp. NPDC086251 TaxID=3364431 RepID=UPI0038378AFD
MRRVFAEIDRQTENLRSHEAFLMISDLSSAEAVQTLKGWGPLFVHLTMTFRDINLMYNLYPDPANDLERAINAHAAVDATHWEMLVTDLNALGVSDDVKSYKDAMTILWSQPGRPIRDYIYWVLHRAQRCGSSPLLKLTAMESCEATVKTFLTHTRPVRALFESATGAKLNYFGEGHIDSEVDNAINLSIFQEVELDPQTLTLALWIVNAHFDDFKVFIGHLSGHPPEAQQS